MPVYPAPTVPPTQNAPYMQQSSLPEGTFFIVVGAIIGFFLLSVFAWRAIVAWSLHRSVKRAAEQANAADSKTLLRPVQTGTGGGSGGFYSAGMGSTLSLGDLGGTTRSKQTPNASLFFSPTAAGVAGTIGSQDNRRSTYMPAGYYQSGGGGGGNASSTHLHAQSMSSNNRFSGYGSGRGGFGPSPPGSPLMPPQSRGGPNSGGGQGVFQGHRGSESRTSLSLPPMPGQRAPSAYLEDLFENHNQPDPRDRRY